MSSQFELPLDLRSYTALENLRDGSAIRIRAIRADDRDRLLEHFLALSPRSRYLRFLSIRRRLNSADLAYFTELDFRDRVGLAATVFERGQERFIGVGRYIRLSDSTRAEVAFAVLDSHQGRGIGTLLLEHLARLARANGIRDFEAIVLGQNRQMLEVFAHSGYGIHEQSQEGLVKVTFSIAKAR
jgi:GNAT superfamily N-acetyltransferase